MITRRDGRETSSRAIIVRFSIGVLVFAGLAFLIVWAIVDRLWGEPLLSTIGSRNRPVWLSWTVSCVLLVITLWMLTICVRDVYRAARKQPQKK